MMQDDPFSLPESDRTNVVPTPGRRGIPAQRSAGPVAAEEPAGMATIETGGLNPVVEAANPLLDAVPQLRATLDHPNPGGLRASLAQGIKQFETRAQAAGVSPEKIIAARYVLCTLLDETAASTPWGGSGIWGRHSLLVLFHNEAWGGEKFFQLLSKLAENPAANRDLLELMYIALSLGFKGRYQVIENGQAGLAALRERLAQMLRKQRGDYERALSPHWQGVAVKGKNLLTALPLWIAGGVLGVVVLGIYLALSYGLNERSDPVYAQLQRLQPRSLASPARQSVATVAQQPRLAALLQPDTRQGLITVRDENSRSIVTIRGDGLFAPGSATVSPAYHVPLQHVAQALEAWPGPVRVVGHTDNQPVRSARFPSNWHLSQERARAVMTLLKEHSPSPGRYSAEGRADTEPLGPNETAVQRAVNRRVEIVLATSTAGG